MKKTFAITFKVSVDYPYAEKHLKKMSQDFDAWLKEWSTNSAEDIIPVLYEPNKSGAIEHTANGTIRVKITRDRETIRDTWWDNLSNDF